MHPTLSNETQGMIDNLDRQGFTWQGLDRGHETVNTIDEKMRNLNYLKFDSIRGRIRASLNRASASANTKGIAQKLEPDIVILHQESRNILYDEYTYSQERAVGAYNRLKDQYNSGTLNETAKGWYKEIDFDYTQDDQ
jgi:hypothetical protein